MVRIVLVLSFIFFVQSSYAQNEKKVDKLQLLKDSIANTKKGKPFYKDTVFVSLNGKPINFTDLKQNTFVCFGMYSCHPCMQELPVLVQLAKEHPEINFVYATHNDAKTIGIEFDELLGKGYQLPANFEQVIMKASPWGYPTKYFLDKNGMVKYFSFGGSVFKEDIFDKQKAALVAVINTYNN